jgi:acyl-CoA thioesterase
MPGGWRVTDQLDPFSAATAVRPLGDGSFVAELHADWVVGERPHGGYLLALLARAASHVGKGWGFEPLSVSAQFLRPPKVGPVLLRTERLKTGRTVSVVRAVLEQSGQACVDTTINLGLVPEEDAAWSDLPEMPVNPPAEAIDMGASDTAQFAALSRTCDLRLDPSGAGFLTGSTTEPLRLRLWVKPRAAQPDLLFSLVAGDIAMPVTFNLGRFGWSPTVQLTALLRARPANGWLRLVVESKAVHGQWFDEDALVVDSTGRLVCQARQLALSSET